MSADEIKKTPDVEAAAEPEKTEAEAPAKTEPEAAEKKPAAKNGRGRRGQEAGRQEAGGRQGRGRGGGDEGHREGCGQETGRQEACREDEGGGREGRPEGRRAGRREGRRQEARREGQGPAKPAAKKAPAEKAEPVAAERPPKQKVEPKAETEARKGAAGVATVVDASGKELETRKLADARFAVPADVNTLHLVVRAEQAARRSGTASTKTRGQVSGSTAKLYRQKGTGRARAGSVKSPIRTGGGVVFGPHPRSFDIKINKKVIRKALSMALSERAANGRVFVAAGLELTEPSTRTVEQFLVNLDCAAPVLLVTHDEPVVTKSVRNLPYAEATEVAALSTEQVLRARSLVLTEKAFAALNEA